jgi:hypothetical protein
VLIDDVKVINNTYLNINVYLLDDKKLTDEEITNFVSSLLPIAFHILYSNYDDERKTIFNILSTLRPGKQIDVHFNVNCFH